MNNKTYKYKGHPYFKECIQVSDDSQNLGRYYRTPEKQDYPSITTILSCGPKPALDNWRKRIGDKAADFESQWARDRGDSLHSHIEILLQNKRINDCPLLVRMMIQDLQPYLLKIDNIHLQEKPLHSDVFKIAGRCDLIAEYDGVPSVIDFKGSNRPKKEEWIENYFIQASFYAYAYFERTGIKVPQIAILIGTEKGEPQEFIACPKDYWKKLKEKRKEFREIYNI